MKAQKTRIYVTLVLLTAASHVMTGCGKEGGRMYEQVGGDVAWSDLDPDSVPAAPEADSGLALG